jgi:ABC-2 type transport system ATP-binding protein
VILTTHDLADVERLAPRIVLIDEGTVIYDGQLSALREEYGAYRTLVVTLAENYPEIAVEGAQVHERDGSIARLRFNRHEVTAETLIRRVLDTYRITDLAIEEPDIDSIVRRIYTEGYRAQPLPIGG